MPAGYGDKGYNLREMAEGHGVGCEGERASGRAGEW